MSTLLTWGLGAGGSGPAPTGSDLEQVIVSAMEGSTTLAALLGDRIYPAVIPQTATLPAMAYKFTDAKRDSHLRGPAGVVYTTVQFEIESPTHADVVIAREILRNLFQGLIGTLGTVRIWFVWLENEMDDYYEPIAGSDAGTHYKRFDMRFKTPESLPTHS